MTPLLDSLRAERAKHGRRYDKNQCHASGCGKSWPCKLSRALDVAIAGVVGLEKMRAETVALVCAGDRDECPLCSAHAISEETLAAMSKAWDAKGAS